MDIMSNDKPLLLLEGMEVIFAHGLVGQRLTCEGTANVEELECDHEEADTRMLLHVQHAASTYGSIVIYSPDTDVLVLAVSFALSISAELFMSMGTANVVKNVSASAIALNDKMTAGACSALIGLHCFTGCGSVSAFRYKGTGADDGKPQVSGNVHGTWNSLGPT